MAKISGTPFDELLIGTNATDEIQGDAGADLIFGRGGRDVIDGGEGDDVIFGGSGADEIAGGPGGDRILAGSGNDVVIYDATVDDDPAKTDLYSGQAGSDTLRLLITQQQSDSDAVKEDIARFQSWLGDGSPSTFQFNAFPLTVHSFEALDVVVSADETPLPQVAIQPFDSNRLEGDGGTTAFTFQVARSGVDLSQPSSVSYTVVPGDTSPADAGDFAGATFPSGTVIFGPGEVNQLITIGVAGDTVKESDEQFKVVLSSPVNARIADAQATGFIRNDDIDAPTVRLESVESKAEGNAAASTAFNVVLTRAGDLTQATTFELRVEGSGTNAADGADFVEPSLPFTVPGAFEVGESSVTVPVRVFGDEAVERDETFTVQVVNLQNGVLDAAQASAQATIVNDDQEVSVALVQAVKAEGNPSETPVVFEFEVTRSGKTDEALAVGWELRAAALNSADFEDLLSGQPLVGTVAFAPNETSKTVSVSIAGDLEVEPDEGFALVLDAGGLPAGTTLGSVSAEATIKNDDAQVLIAPTFSQSEDEGDPGGSPTVFSWTLTREGDLSGALTVNFAVTPRGGDGVSGDDFVGGALPMGQVTFAPGAAQASSPISVEVNPDTTAEPDEDFLVTLTLPAGSPAGTTFVVDRVGGTIADDDTQAPAFLAIAPEALSQNEGNSDTTVYAFTVTRSGNTGGETTVAFAVTPMGADAADFVGGLPAGGMLIFDAGETEKTITVNVAGDTALEPNEDFEVVLSSPSANAQIVQASATGTIRNDDAPPPQLAIQPFDSNRLEGDGGTTAFTFQVARSGVDLSQPSSVSYTVVPGDTSPADAGDFAGATFPSGTVIFGPGEVNQLITIGVAGDTDIEPGENFKVVLSNPVNGVLQDFEEPGTIRNDDGGATTAVAESSADARAADAGKAGVELAGDSDDNTLTGTDGDDNLTGGGGDDQLIGLDGNDRLTGGSGDDSVNGGDGDDVLIGGSGDDELMGAGGDDGLVGGSGNDTLNGGGGNDELFGGSGEDVFDFDRVSANNGSKEQDVIRDYQAGEDVVQLSGGAPTDADVLATGENSITVALPDSPDGDTLEILGVNSLDDVTFITK